MILDWKSIGDEREKYSAYLASREWALLKEQVRARSGGRCEHCETARGTQTHHQTYARKYRELLSDLLHVCEPCHLFLSAKSDHDPAKVVLDYAMLGDREIRSVYLAGKITGTTWRDEIAPGWSFQNHSDFDYRGRDFEGGEWRKVYGVIPAGKRSLLAMTGPFWRYMENYSGHGGIWSSGGLHANGRPGLEDLGHGQVDPIEVTQTSELILEIRRSIKSSDLVFAWIDSMDCFGTLAEIGYAVGCGVPVVVANPWGFPRTELWLAIALGECIQASSPSKAWKLLWMNSEYWPHEGSFLGRLETPVSRQTGQADPPEIQIFAEPQ